MPVRRVADVLAALLVVQEGLTATLAAIVTTLVATTDVAATTIVVDTTIAADTTHMDVARAFCADDLNPLANQTTGLLGADNPAYDPVNGYGNESSNRKTLTLGGKNYVLARTGYFEREVADYNLRNWKGDVSLYYKPNEKSSISYTYRTAFLNSIYQRSNRFRLENYLLQLWAIMLLMYIKLSQNF